ncbi:MAG: tripartite tricarboxylate transporter substrate-binding protein [Burkholderiaceae bacterium]
MKPMSNGRRTALRAMPAALALAAGTSARAAEPGAFPSKPIRLLVPFPTGSGTDLAARIIAAEAARAAGQSVVVENKPGANGIIATGQVARAAPDGYTMLITSNSHVANRHLFKRLPYDPIADFKAVAMYRRPTPLILAVGPASKHRSIADLAAAARAPGAKLSYASGNSSSHVAGELFRQVTGADMLYVPFKGNAEAMTEVAAGRVDMIFADLGAFLDVGRGLKLVPLVVTGPEPLAALEGVPASPDAGLGRLSISSWGVFLVPSATPDAVADRLHQLVAAAVRTPAMQQYLVASSSVAHAPPRAEIEAFLRSELTYWGAIIQKAGIEPQ